MKRKSDNVLVDKTWHVGAATSAAGVVSVLIIVTVLAVSSGSSGADAGDTGIGQNPAPVSFTVGTRADQLYYFPCADCHEFMDSNRKMRELEVEEGHPEMLKHGDGQMWCFSCHDPSNYGQLQDLLSESIDFDHGYRVCNGCHSQKYRDWTQGGHGKRVANWLGKRRLYSCVECHNPHQPAIAPRAPKPPPPIRAGLESMAPAVVDESRNLHRPFWEQFYGQ